MHMRFVWRSVVAGILLFAILYFVIILAFLGGNLLGNILFVGLFLVSLIFTIYLYQHKDEERGISNIPTVHDITISLTVFCLIGLYTFVFLAKNMDLANSFMFGVTDFGNFIFIFAFANISFLIMNAIFAKYYFWFNAVPTAYIKVLKRKAETGSYDLRKEDSPHYTRVLSMMQLSGRITILLAIISLFYAVRPI